MPRWPGCPPIDEWCDTMSKRCRSSGVTTICIMPSTVDHWTSNPTKLMLKFLLGWHTWAVAVWHRTSCFCAQISLTRVSGLLICPWLLRWCPCLRIGGRYYVLLYPKCSPSRYGQWSGAGVCLWVGFNLCLWWRVVKARPRLRDLFQLYKWRQNQIQMSGGASGRVVVLSWQGWVST